MAVSNCSASRRRRRHFLILTSGADLGGFPLLREATEATAAWEFERICMHVAYSTWFQFMVHRTLTSAIFVPSNQPWIGYFSWCIVQVTVAHEWIYIQILYYLEL